MNSAVFKNIYLKRNECFDFLFNFFSETFLIVRRTERDIMKKRALVFMKSTGYSCSISTKLEFFLLFFEKFSNIKFYRNPPNGSRVVPREPKDRRKVKVAFGNFANAANKGRHTVNTGKEEVKVWRKRLVS